MGHPVKVLVVNPSPVRGGAEQMLEAFALRSDPARAVFDVACLAPGPFPEELRAAGGRVIDVPAGRMRHVHRWGATVGKLASLARRYDVVCSWQVKGHYYGTPAARMARKPAVWWDHGIRPSRGEPSAFAGGVIPKSLNADLVLTSSEIAAKRHRNGRAIHPGIDVDAFAAPSRAPGDPCVVGIVGRLQPWKGQHVFLRAAALVPSARFVVVGDAIGGFSAGYPAQLRALVAELGIQDRVTFAGHRDDVAAVLATLDVFVHASLDEPFGIVILEALAAGVPVIAADGGGVPEIIQDGVNGFLVEHGDAETIAHAIEALLSDAALRQRFIAQGLQTVREHFTTQRMVEDFTRALEEIAIAPVTV